MKTSISSDVWEKKKAVIAKLYMEEEWPLKQVIKQIRSDDFNPSETQLRSRLKKWRVTKPSRQTRKKRQGSDDPESEKDSQGSTSPRNSKTSPVTRRPSSSSSISRSNWARQSIYTPAETPQPGKWNAHIAQQLTPSPSNDHTLLSEGRPESYSFSEANPTTTSFAQPGQTSPVTEGLLLNTTSAVTPIYAAYPLSPESCMPSPGPSATPTVAQWPPPSVPVDMGFNPALHSAQWYGMSLEPISPPSGVPHSATLAPSLHPIVPPGSGVFSPEFVPYGMPDYHGYDAKQWKRTVSLQYDYAGHHGQPEHERKHLNHHGLHPHAMVPIPTPQAGPHSVTCAPMVSYMS
ncbi:hypothetical protein F1880_001979 [Penicillium rolfsii]|nr:hypothetical protein F1880_001979 [Penicillium rolfsii]